MLSVSSRKINEPDVVDEGQDVQHSRSLDRMKPAQSQYHPPFPLRGQTDPGDQDSPQDGENDLDHGGRGLGGLGSLPERREEDHAQRKHRHDEQQPPERPPQGNMPPLRFRKHFL